MKKKEIIQLSITGILIIILFFVVAHNIKGKKQTKSVIKKELSAKTVASQEASKAKGLYSRLDEEVLNIELKRDPFFEAPFTASQEDSSSDLYLNGIAWDENYPAAIINNMIVRIGSRIGGKTVMDIKKDKVILDDGRHHFEMTIEDFKSH
jgi:hypothetical protein